MCRASCSKIIESLHLKRGKTRNHPLSAHRARKSVGPEATVTLSILGPQKRLRGCLPQSPNCTSIGLVLWQRFSNSGVKMATSGFVTKTGSGCFFKLLGGMDCPAEGSAGSPFPSVCWWGKY